MDALKYPQYLFLQCKLPATTLLDSPPPPRVSPVKCGLLHQRQRSPPRVRPQPLPINPPAQYPRVLPTRPPPQSPRVHPTSPPSYSAPINRRNFSQSQPTIPPPDTPARALPQPLEPITHRTRSLREASHVVTAHSAASGN